jgi:hypothetical protein
MNNLKKITMVAVATTALAITVTSCKKGDQPVKAEVKKAASSQLTAEFETVKGRWLRPDGGYVIELKELLPNNQLAAGYFNPGPINVGEAKIYKENGFLKVFVKMQDKNYPGSTYTLIYDKANDQLRGVYFQAVQGVEYQVGFTRLSNK